VYCRILSRHLEKGTSMVTKKLPADTSPIFK